MSGVAPGLPAGCVVELTEDSFHLLHITYLCLFKLQSYLRGTTLAKVCSGGIIIPRCE